jgi:hypothetical protein
LALALAAFSQFENGRSPFGRTLWVPLLYQVLLVTPALLYFGFVFPDWTWLYLVDPHRLPVGITILSVFATAAALLGGYLVGWVLLRARRRRELVGVVAVTVLSLFVSLLMLRERLGRAGSYAEFVAGHAPKLGERKLGWSLALVSAGLIFGLIASLRFLVVQGRREREG